MNRIIANFLKPSGPLGAIRKSVGAEKSGEVPDGPPRLICAPPIASRGNKPRGAFVFEPL